MPIDRWSPSGATTGAGADRIGAAVVAAEVMMAVAVRASLKRFVVVFDPSPEGARQG
ncbi:MAG: hypothetical protein AB7K09_25480 [Planctomycetota bacterium]